MEGENNVKLLGACISSYSKRVEMALRIKGIPYEFIEEDLSKPSPLLLQYKIPIHGKIPVLVHNGKPLADSYTMLEYIEETWKNAPKLLPEDPYERAQIRFWVCFIQQQLFEAMGGVMTSDEEAERKAIEQLFEKMNVLEKGMAEIFPEGSRKIQDKQNLEMLDILMATTFSPYKAYEEVFRVNILDSGLTPLISSWVKELNEIPLVKELHPPRDKLVSLLHSLRQKLTM